MKYCLSPKKYGTHGIIINKIPNKACVLDVGCAQGYLSKILSNDKHCDVFGMDVEKSSIQKAKKYCSATLLGDVEKTIDMVTKKFDVILLADILEHLIDPYKFMLKIRKNITKNGYVIISMPNVGYFFIRIKLLMGCFNYSKTGIMDNTHLHFYTKTSAERLIKASGFAIEEVVPVGELNYCLGKVGLFITKLFPKMLASQFVWKVKLCPIKRKSLL